MNKNFVLKEFIIFIIFGLMYVTIELLYRGHTHYSMFIVGGICGVLIGLINDNTPDMPLLPQCVLGAVIITIIELLTGLFLNVYLGLNVWDYSNQPFNFMGQICPQFCIIWCILSILVIRIDDWLKEKVLKTHISHLYMELDI